MVEAAGDAAVLVETCGEGVAWWNRWAAKGLRHMCGCVCVCKFECVSVSLCMCMFAVFIGGSKPVG